MDSLKVSPEVELLIWMEFFVTALRGDDGPLTLAKAIEYSQGLERTRSIWFKLSPTRQDAATKFMKAHPNAPAIQS